MTREEMFRECVTPNEEVFDMCDKHYQQGRTHAFERSYNTILTYENTIRSMLLNTNQEDNLLEWVDLNGKLNAIAQIKHMIYDLEHLKEQK